MIFQLYRIPYHLIQNTLLSTEPTTLYSEFANSTIITVLKATFRLMTQKGARFQSYALKHAVKSYASRNKCTNVITLSFQSMIALEIF